MTAVDDGEVERESLIAAKIAAQGVGEHILGIALDEFEARIAGFDNPDRGSRLFVAADIDAQHAWLNANARLSEHRDTGRMADAEASFGDERRANKPHEIKEELGLVRAHMAFRSPGQGTQNLAQRRVNMSILPRSKKRIRHWVFLLPRAYHAAAGAWVKSFPARRPVR